MSEMGIRYELDQKTVGEQTDGNFFKDIMPKLNDLGYNVWMSGNNLYSYPTEIIVLGQIDRMPSDFETVLKPTGVMYNPKETYKLILDENIKLTSSE